MHPIPSLLVNFSTIAEKDGQLVWCILERSSPISCMVVEKVDSECIGMDCRGKQLQDVSAKEREGSISHVVTMIEGSMQQLESI